MDWRFVFLVLALGAMVASFPEQRRLAARRREALEGLSPEEARRVRLLVGKGEAASERDHARAAVAYAGTFLEEPGRWLVASRILAALYFAANAGAAFAEGRWAGGTFTLFFLLFVLIGGWYFPRRARARALQAIERNGPVTEGL